MLGYMQNLIQIWGNDAFKLFILKIGISLHMIMDALGLGLKAPLAICVKDENIAEAVFKELSGFNPSNMIPLGLPKKEFENRILKIDYELISIFCNLRSRNDSDNLETVRNAMTLKSLRGNIFCALPVIAFCGSIPPDLSEHFSGKCVIDSKVMVSRTVNSDEIARNLVETLMDSLPLIEYKLQNLDSYDSNMYFFRGSAEIGKMLIEREKSVNESLCLELIQGIEQALKALEEEWEIVNDFSTWLDSLRDIIWESAKYQTGIINRKAVSYGDEVLLDMQPIYDENFYYFTPEFFSELCKEIPYAGETELKRAMHNAGILIGEGRNRIYFEVKVPIKTNLGVKVTKRRLRIVRSWLDLPGQLSWKYLIEMKRGTTR